MNKKITVILLVFVFRIFYALNVNLIDDEAYHWSWSKNLMLSYYDHPGMIAWLNWLSTSIFGDTVLGVRLPSFIFYSLTIFICWKLAKELFDEKVSFFVTLLFLWTPFWGFGGYVNSPEPVFIFCWLWGAWVFWQGHRNDKLQWSIKKTWLWLGIIMGLGLNSKFIMANLAFGFGVYLLSTKEGRNELLSRWPWVGVFISTILCTPIFLWNLQYDWPGFKYQFHHRHAEGSFSVLRWLEWFATQFVLYTPALYILILISFFFCITKIKDPRFRFLWSLTLPSYVMFYIQPLFAEYKPHWSGPASIFMAIVAGYLYNNGLQLKDRVLIVPRSRRWRNSLLYILVPLNIFIYSPFAYPFFPKVFRLFSDKQWNIRNDLSNEFFGWEAAGKELLRKQKEIHSSTGVRPFLAAIRYETTAQTIWGIRNDSQETIYMINKFVSHYTVVQNKWNLLEKFKGLDALILTTEKYPDDPMEYGHFTSCTREEFKYYRADELSRIFYIWHCKNFTGIKN